MSSVSEIRKRFEAAQKKKQGSVTPDTPTERKRMPRPVDKSPPRSASVQLPKKAPPPKLPPREPVRAPTSSIDEKRKLLERSLGGMGMPRPKSVSINATNFTENKKESRSRSYSLKSDEQPPNKPLPKVPRGKSKLTSKPNPPPPRGNPPPVPKRLNINPEFTLKRLPLPAPNRLANRNTDAIQEYIHIHIQKVMEKKQQTDQKLLEYPKTRIPSSTIKIKSTVKDYVFQSWIDDSIKNTLNYGFGVIDENGDGVIEGQPLQAIWEHIDVTGSRAPRQMDYHDFMDRAQESLYTSISNKQVEAIKQALSVLKDPKSDLAERFVHIDPEAINNFLKEFS